MNMNEAQIISNEEYIEMLKPYDVVYAERLQKGMQTFHEVPNEIPDSLK